MLDALTERTAVAPPPIHRDGVWLRPMRFLVMTRRHSPYHISQESTLTASDLGITRHTTDAELAAIAASYGRYENTLRSIRDGLRQPRDIEEARQWGFVIPVNEHENREETLAENNKRLGWWWVYDPDPDHYETEQQRRARYMADDRLVTVKGLARIICRALFTTRDIHNDTVDARRVVNDEPGALDTMLNRFIRDNPGYDGTPEEARKLVVASAHEFLLRGTPVPDAKIDDKDTWTVSAALTFGRRARKINEWYEWTKGTHTGRPYGSRTRHWKSRSNKTTEDTPAAQ